MRVEWTNYAIERRDQIANYIRDRFGAKHKDKFMQEVRKTTKTLKSSPNLGSVDPLFRLLTGKFQQNL